MSEYLLINIFTILMPLILSFEGKIKFYKKFPAFLFSFLTIGTAYIIWDVFATLRGDWSFNPDYILGIELFHLPLEEILFFVTVPYATLFIYETGLLYLGDKELPKKIINPLLIILFIGFILTGILFSHQPYTLTVMLYSAAFILITFLLYKKLLYSRLYWQFILFTYIPFGAVNYLLTSFPIVSYGEDAIWGIRITTIPFEDFFYSYSMLSLFLLVYLYVKEKWLKEKE